MLNPSRNTVHKKACQERSTHARSVHELLLIIVLVMRTFRHNMMRARIKPNGGTDLTMFPWRQHNDYIVRQ